MKKLLTWFVEPYEKHKTSNNLFLLGEAVVLFVWIETAQENLFNVFFWLLVLMIAVVIVKIIFRIRKYGLSSLGRAIDS